MREYHTVLQEVLCARAAFTDILQDPTQAQTYCETLTLRMLGLIWTLPLIDRYMQELQH